jgi:hypothetical protein
MIDLLAEAAATVALKVLLAVLHDLLFVGAVVAFVAVVAHRPIVQRVPIVGMVFADIDRGTKRLFVRPAEKLLRHCTAFHRGEKNLTARVKNGDSVARPDPAPTRRRAATWISRFGGIRADPRGQAEVAGRQVLGVHRGGLET